MSRSWIMLVLVVIASACDRPKPQTKGETTTTVRPHSVIDPTPATLPATRPTVSKIIIDGREFTFPAARLVLQQAEPTVDVLLFSDDPPDALSTSYAGKSRRARRRSTHPASRVRCVACCGAGWSRIRRGAGRA